MHKATPLTAAILIASLLGCIYGPGAPAFDGSWKPGDFEEVK
jgi:hypothetical protein